MVPGREDWREQDEAAERCRNERIVRPGPRRGGMKDKPTTPRPNVTPPGQKSLSECDNFGCCARTERAMICPECLDEMRRYMEHLEQRIVTLTEERDHWERKYRMS